MDKTLVLALQAAEKEMPRYIMTKVYDCDDFYFFECVRKRDGQEGNGPCIDKKTPKSLSINSSSLISIPYSHFYDVDDIKNFSNELNQFSEGS